MIATFTALLFAHVLADFVFQTDWIIAHKRRPYGFLAHALVVALTAWIALGFADPLALAVLVAAHMAIDAVKTFGGFRDLRAFLIDQAAHIAVICAISWASPGLWETGAWAAYPGLLQPMALLTGLILTLRTGEYATALLMRPYRGRVNNAGLKNGGRVIGLLERGLIFVLIGLGQPLGVGFLVAAKSVLRFGTATRDQRSAEYVIIGTLASFGWAILVAYGTFGALKHLPALEISRPLP